MHLNIDKDILAFVLNVNLLLNSLDVKEFRKVWCKVLSYGRSYVR